MYKAKSIEEVKTVEGQLLESPVIFLPSEDMATFSKKIAQLETPTISVISDKYCTHYVEIIPIKSYVLQDRSIHFLPILQYYDFVVRQNFIGKQEYLEDPNWEIFNKKELTEIISKMKDKYSTPKKININIQEKGIPSIFPISQVGHDFWEYLNIVTVIPKTLFIGDFDRNSRSPLEETTHLRVIPFPGSDSDLFVQEIQMDEVHIGEVKITTFGVLNVEKLEEKIRELKKYGRILSMDSNI